MLRNDVTDHGFLRGLKTEDENEKAESADQADGVTPLKILLYILAFIACFTICYLLYRLGRWCYWRSEERKIK